MGYNISVQKILYKKNIISLSTPAIGIKNKNI